MEPTDYAQGQVPNFDHGVAGNNINMLVAAIDRTSGPHYEASFDGGMTQMPWVNDGFDTELQYYLDGGGQNLEWQASQNPEWQVSQNSGQDAGLNIIKYQQ